MRLAFLGDEYSVTWLEDSDAKAHLNGYTLKQQFEKVKRKVTNSHVMQYGDSNMGSLMVGQFQGQNL